MSNGNEDRSFPFSFCEVGAIAGISAAKHCIVTNTLDFIKTSSILTFNNN